MIFVPPLTSIIGYLGLVINGKPKTPEETKRYAEIAYHKAQQMKALVDDLFEYTRQVQMEHHCD